MSTYNERAYRALLHIPVQSRLHKNGNIYLKSVHKNRSNQLNISYRKGHFFPDIVCHHPLMQALKCTYSAGKS